MKTFEIVCPDEQMLRIEEHCFSETRIEVGGFLIGKIEAERTTVTQAVAANHTIGKSTQLTFTHDTWNDIYATLAKLPKDVSLIGWYHSHPNFGVFLSEHDQFIQNNFFKSKGQITIVVDPIRGRRGWFRSIEGKIEKYDEEVDTMKPRLGVSSTDADANMDTVLGIKPQSASNLKIIAISGFMAALSFVAGLLVNNISQSTQQEAIIQKVVQRVMTVSPTVSGGWALAPVTPAPMTPPKSSTSTSRNSVTSSPTPPTQAQPKPEKTITSNKAGGTCSTAGYNVKIKGKDYVCSTKLKWEIPQPVSGQNANTTQETTTGTGKKPGNK
jgi:proteasome lid subunit RPN8/RPN11